MNNKFLILLLTFISLQFVYNFKAYSQPSITWQRLYDDPLHKTEYGTGFAFASSDSSSFYVAGYIYAPIKGYILKININSDTVWTRVFDIIPVINAACGTNDNSCLVTGNGDPLWIRKINNQGNLVWTQTYGGYYANLRDIKAVSNRRYIACGSNNTDSSGHIMLIDTLGNLIWQRDYSSNNKKLFFSIAEIPQKGYLAAGYTVFSDTTRNEIILVNYSGDVIWEKNFKILNSPGQIANKILYFNGNIYLAGNYTQYDNQNNGTTNMYLSKIDTNGTILSIHSVYNFKNTEIFGNMNIINQNKIIFTSYNNIFPDDSNYARILILDSSGIIKKEKYIWSIYKGDNILRCIQPLSNGNILFTGDANYRINYPIDQGPIDIWVVMSDSVLNFPDSLIGIKKISSEIPTNYKLFQNYPNPFNTTTKIKFSIPFKNRKVNLYIKIIIYDILGQEVKKLVNENLNPGIYEVIWDGSNFSSGVYFYRIFTDEFSETKKLILLK